MSRQTTLACIIITTFVLQSYAGEYWYDDFEDNNPHDRSPVSWTRGQAIDGQLLLEGSGMIISTPFVPHHDRWSMQSQLSLSKATYIGLGVRFTQSGNVWLGFQLDGSLEIGTPGVTLAEAQTDLDPENVMLRFDAFDDTISGWAWEPGNEMPVDPLVVAKTPLKNGHPGIWIQGSQSHGAAEFFETATIPKSEILPGDFDVNGILGVIDSPETTQEHWNQRSLVMLALQPKRM